LRVDALIFGGDIAGKLLVPIVRRGADDYVCDLFGDRTELSGRQELERALARLRASGRYPVVLTAEQKTEYDRDADRVATELFPRVVRDALQGWVELAEERLAQFDIPAFVMLGNDDYPELEPLLSGVRMFNCEGSRVELPGGFEMVSLGYSNRTPWNSPRELDEDDLASRIDSMVEELADPGWAIFNFHCPPYKTNLDKAPLLDADLRPRLRGGQIEVGSVGSTAVRAAIEQYQPLIGLHGHIHESPGMHRIGRSLALNPGSDYGSGILRATMLNLDGKKGVRSWQMIQL
jgi:Icc-related predicted phosphoesterase